MKISLKETRLDVFIWVCLIIFTLLTVSLGHSIGSLTDAMVNTSILIITFIKTRLIIMHFMEVKRAPLLLRLIFEAWGIVVCAVLIVLLLF